LVPGWTKPIVIGRHAFGDQYRATDFLFPGAGKLTMRFEPEDGSEPIEKTVYDATEAGVAMGMYNLDESICGFARACLNYGLDVGWPVLLSTKIRSSSNTMVALRIYSKKPIKPNSKINMPTRASPISTA
jgi:isocitrate dehydrogenase